MALHFKRMYGFAASLAAGLLLMFLSVIVFVIPIKFALLFTFANEKIHSKILTVIAILCKTCALMWYNLSYIPFARRIVSEIMILSL
ncbi:hypothetical protein BRARA_K01436 [Brassica rapa]|uniref:Vesicle transport protein n=1 Tax=Brassica campestris TaxID=3711 RepID=A0A397KVH0_BRACM|nr:hypothetical protein BRARA_K01436 [Brassica rapa]